MQSGSPYGQSYGGSQYGQSSPYGAPSSPYPASPYGGAPAATQQQSSLYSPNSYQPQSNIYTPAAPTSDVYSPSADFNNSSPYSPMHGTFQLENHLAHLHKISSIYLSSFKKNQRNIVL
jgi:hypothetical protein